LLDLDAELGYKFRQQFIGETAEILVENGEKGRSERYFMVYLEKTGENPQKGELVRMRLIKNSENGLIGQIERRDN
jgi:tRNA A37 methylthiotransferase MiaB